jgi:hypothetical protein
MKFIKTNRGAKNMAIFGCGLVEFPETPLYITKTLHNEHLRKRD